MWRLGLGEDNRSSKEKKHLRKRSRQAVGYGSDTVTNLSVNLHDEKEKRPSIVAAEHLLMQRLSRTAGMPHGLHGDATKHPSTEQDIELDQAKAKSSLRKFSFATTRIDSVREIQDRVKKVVMDFETNMEVLKIDDQDLVEEITQNLGAIEDDMLRINVSSLINKFRYMSMKMKEEDDYWDEKRTRIEKSGTYKQELLEAVHSWLEQDKFHDIDDFDENSLKMPDSEEIEGFIGGIQINVAKIADLQNKIVKYKKIGTDTTFLERETKNLRVQVQQEMLDRQHAVQRKSLREFDPSKPKSDFSYLKNAATEIYELVQRTRMEGMAESAKIEEEMNRLIQYVDEKEKHVEYLEQRIEQQKKLVRRWCTDYDKLQSEYILTRDEALAERKNNANLKQQINELKKRMKGDAANELEAASLQVLHLETTLRSYEQQIQALKQKIEVAVWSVKEKERTVEDQARQINQLKAALRRGSIGNQQDLHHYKSSTAASKNLIAGYNDLEVSVTYAGLPHPCPSPSPSWIADELNFLRRRIEVLEAENEELVQTLSRHQKHPMKPAGVQTDLGGQKKWASTETLPAAKCESVATQTDVITSALSTMTEEDRISSYHVIQKLSKLYGEDWKEAAVTISKLYPDDIQKIINALSYQEDVITMYSDAPAPESRPVVGEKSKSREIKTKGGTTKGVVKTETNKRPSRQSKGEKAAQPSHARLSTKERPGSIKIYPPHIGTATTVQEPRQTIYKEDIKTVSTALPPIGLAKDQTIVTQASSDMPTFLPGSDADASLSAAVEEQIIDTKGTPFTGYYNEQEENLYTTSIEDLQACKVSNSILEIAEDMLSAKEPTEILHSEGIGIGVFLEEADAMAETIGNFVDKMQGLIGTRSGMMSNVNEFIKQTLPVDVQEKLEKNNSFQNAVSMVHCLEHSSQWQDMAGAEKLRSKIKLVEDAMRDMVDETVSMFVGEVAKQQAEYSEIHTAMKENPDLDVNVLMPDKGEALQNMKGKVEASMRHITRLNRAERQPSNYKNKRIEVGHFLNTHGRAAGRRTHNDPKSINGSKLYPLQQLQKMQQKPKFGVQALEGLITGQLISKKAVDTRPQGISDKKTRYDVKDVRQAINTHKNRWKPNDLTKITAPAVSPQGFLSQGQLLTKPKIFNPLGGTQFESPKPSSRAQQQKRKRPPAEEITMLDIHNQLNEQFNITFPKQTNVASRIAPIGMPNFLQPAVERGLLAPPSSPPTLNETLFSSPEPEQISFFTQQIYPVRDEDIKLPRIT